MLKLVSYQNRGTDKTVTEKNGNVKTTLLHEPQLYP